MNKKSNLCQKNALVPHSSNSDDLGDDNNYAD